jgi:hypothetical protein
MDKACKVSNSKFIAKFFLFQTIHMIPSIPVIIWTFVLEEKGTSCVYIITDILSWSIQRLGHRLVDRRNMVQVLARTRDSTALKKVQTSCGAHWGHFLQTQGDELVKIIYVRLVPRSEMSGAVTPLPYTLLWHAHGHFSLSLSLSHTHTQNCVSITNSFFLELKEVK